MTSFKNFLKNYQNILLMLIGLFIVFVFIFAQSIPVMTSIHKTKNDYKNAKNILADKERQLNDLKEKIAEFEQEEKQISKPFYKTIDTGMDTESVIANEFGEILQIIQANSIKTRSIEYQYDPSDDNFVKNAPSQFHVARLKLEMIGPYKNFESFLKELFKHEHFLDIESIEVSSYAKNKRILIVHLTLKLYAQKS